jgi:hypothetical protein
MGPLRVTRSLVLRPNSDRARRHAVHARNARVAGVRRRTIAPPPRSCMCRRAAASARVLLPMRRSTPVAAPWPHHRAGAFVAGTNASSAEDSATAVDDQQSYRQVPSPLPLLEGERDDGAGGVGPIPTGCWPPSGLHWVQGVRSTRPWEDRVQPALSSRPSVPKARTVAVPHDRRRVPETGARVPDPGTGRAWPMS